MHDRVYKFAEFELTLPNGDLRTSNSTVRLQEKPLLLLTELLDHPQQLVTRQELRDRMWDRRTVVDYEQGINVAMKKVRDALGDSSEDPKFIDTVARKGYRFLVPVTVISPTVEKSAITEVDRVGANLTIAEPKASAKLTVHRRWLLLAISSAILFALALGVSEIRKRPRDAVQIPSLAVLPFLDLSAEGNQGYFSDGIAEEVLNVLSHVQGLKVASRTSSFQFRKSELGAPAIAQKLGVRYVLEGSVRKAGDTVRITAQLIDSNTDRHEWSDTFDRPLSTANLFAIQDEIAKHIVDHLAAVIGNAAKVTEPAARKADTADLDAYDLYLKGHALFIARTRDNLVEAARVLRTAVGKDPNFARAWESLAATLVVSQYWGVGQETDQQEAADAADTALRLDPNLSLPYAVRGEVQSGLAHDRGADSWDDALADYSRAIERDGNNATAYSWRAEDYASLGFMERAVQDYLRCLDIDPAYELCRRHLAITYVYLGRTDDALREYESGLENGYTVTNVVFAPAAAARGDRLGALGMLENDFRNYPRLIRLLFHALTDPSFSEGDRKEAISLIDKVKGIPDGVPTAQLILKAYDKIAVSLSPDPPIWWAREDAAWLESQSRKQMMLYWHLPEYWRKHGFPPQCKPIGESDFECR